jgi:hypothetical protein
MEIRDMARLRATVLATTAVGLMAFATPAFAEVIMTPDGHYYKLVPLKAPPGQASSVVMAGPGGGDGERRAGFSVANLQRVRSPAHRE